MGVPKIGASIISLLEPSHAIRMFGSEAGNFSGLQSFREEIGKMVDYSIKRMEPGAVKTGFMEISDKITDCAVYMVFADTGRHSSKNPYFCNLCKKYTSGDVAGSRITIRDEDYTPSTTYEDVELSFDSLNEYQKIDVSDYLRNLMVNAYIDMAMINSTIEELSKSLAFFPSIEYIELRRVNDTHDIRPLRILPKLEKITIKDSLLRKVPRLSGFKSLKYVFLYFEDIDELDFSSYEKDEKCENVSQITIFASEVELSDELEKNLREKFPKLDAVTLNEKTFFINREGKLIKIEKPNK